MNILVCLPKGEVRDSFFTEENMDLLSKIGKVTYNNSIANFTKEEYQKNIKNKDIVITGWGCPRLDKSILENANSLKLIVHMAGSPSGYFCDEVFNKNIKIMCGNEIIAQSVAEGIIAYILSYYRNIPLYFDNLKNKGIWKPKCYPTFQLIGKTIGIVSYGSVSKYLIKMLKGFNVKILIYSRTIKDNECLEKNIKKVSLEELFLNSDIITIQTALNNNTINMIDNKLLKLIKNGALLINTARAKIIKESDLIEQLKTKRFNAILDVYYREPLEKENPYSKMENVFMMPHMAGPTNEARMMLAKLLILDILNVLHDEKSIYLVNKEKVSSMTRPL